MRGNLECLFEPKTSIFGGWQNEWRIKRVKKLIEIYGENWFAGKKILELACAHGNIGRYLSSLGADVEYCDGRQSVLDEVVKFVDEKKVFLLNQETDWHLIKHYDMIIHFGILYNLDNWKRDLEKALSCCETLVLETAVLKFNSIYEIKIFPQYSIQEHGPISKVGSLVSAKTIENLFDEAGFSYKRYDDEDLNVEHVNNMKFNWKEVDITPEHKVELHKDLRLTNWNNQYCGGRRFWIANKIE